MNEIIDDNKIELVPPPITNLVEDSIASRTKEITKRPKRERSPRKKLSKCLFSHQYRFTRLAVQIQLPAPKVKKAKEVAPKLPDKTKWSLEEQKQFFGALRIVSNSNDIFNILIHFKNCSMARISKHSVNFSIHDDATSILKRKNAHSGKYGVFIIDHFEQFPNYVRLLKKKKQMSIHWSYARFWPIYV